MSGPGARLVAAALVIGLLAACDAQTVVITRQPIPDQPNSPDLVGQALVVGQGNGGELGQYRAWIYRTRDGMTCFEIATQGMSTIGCGPGEDGPARISRTDFEGGWFVGGGTLLPAVTAVVHTADGEEVRGQVDPAPPGVADGTSWVVIPVPGGRPLSVDLLDAGGAILETIEFEP